MADERKVRRSIRNASQPRHPAPTWEAVSRHDRRAEVQAVERLTDTGTVRITFGVEDGRAFDFAPGHWVGVEVDVPGLGRRRSPYCILSPPGDEPFFQILLREFPEGPLAHHLAALRPGDTVPFRGPSGRSMMPKEPETDLVLLATGVGVSPLLSLAGHLLGQGDPRRIQLFWGLRLTDDICLLDELDVLAARFGNFGYQISLSEPPPGWPQLRGRVTESVPPLLERLGGKRYVLSGNGAMVEEMEVALSSLGVDRTFIHGERFFNIRYRPDRATIDAILARFVASDRLSAGPNLEDEGPIFRLHRDVHGRVVGPPQ